MGTIEVLPGRVIQQVADGRVEIPDDMRAALGIEPKTPLLLTLVEGEIHLRPLPVGESSDDSA